MSGIDIRTIGASPDAQEALAALIVEVVAAGRSVSFLHPLAPGQARAFWRDSLAAAERGGRILLGAWDDGLLAGTITLLLDMPPNQPHRGELAKLMTRPGHRRRGIATALVEAAEARAITHGRTLLTLDTAEADGASSIYEGRGFSLAGTIPDYALKPHGGLTSTKLYWKRIGAAAEPETEAP